MHIKSVPKLWSVLGVWGAQRLFKVRVPPWAPEGSAVFAVFLAPRRLRAFLGSGGRCRLSRVKKCNFKSFLIVRGCFWVRVPPLAGSRFWQFLGSYSFLLSGNFKMDNLSFQRVPGQDLPENAPFAFVPHKEFISGIPNFILLHFGFPQRIHVPFQASGSWKTRFSS